MEIKSYSLCLAVQEDFGRRVGSRHCAGLCRRSHLFVPIWVPSQIRHRVRLLIHSTIALSMLTIDLCFECIYGSSNYPFRKVFLTQSILQWRFNDDQSMSTEFRNICVFLCCSYEQSVLY